MNVELKRSDMNKTRKPVFKIPKPDANRILNTAFGRGMAEVIAEKQARIDRLEQMMLCLHENVCYNKGAVILQQDPNDPCEIIYSAILDKVDNLKQSK